MVGVLEAARRWHTWAQQAAHPGPAVPHDELLIMRTITGEIARPLAPPHGVTPRPAAVLILLYPDDHDVRLPLTVRSDALPNHRGEVSLPGGATDPEDDGPVGTALRECAEELGIDPRGVEVLGTLTPLYIPPSNFRITPVVGWHASPPPFQINDQEVHTVIDITLQELLDPARVRVEPWTRGGVEFMVPFFDIAGFKVWGATAFVLSEFVARLRRAMDARPSPPGAATGV